MTPNEQKPLKKHKRIAILLLSFAVGILLSAMIIEPIKTENSETNFIQMLSLSSILTEVLPKSNQTIICGQLSAELKRAGLKNEFQNIKFVAREKRIQKDKNLKILASCFNKNKKSDQIAEVEIFSADFGVEISKNIQTQISIFSSQSSNKIAEVGFNF